MGERPRYRASGAIRYLAPRSSGTLQRIDGWDEVAALSGVRGAKQLLPPGTSQRGLRGSHSRLGYVRVKARDSEDAIALARRGIGKLTLECEAMACSR